MSELPSLYISKLRIWKMKNRKEEDAMKEFFQAVRALSPDCISRAVTVTDGRFQGSRMLLSDGRIVWNSQLSGQNGTDKKPDGEETDAQDYEAFCRELALQWTKMPGCGIYETASGRIFCETPGGEKKLVICGGGHVSIPLIKIGRMMGFHVTVLEDRPKFADHAAAAQASEVFCRPFAQSLADIQGDADTYFVIVTRGHRYDQECLLSIAGKKHAYIGMIGSKKRAAAVKSAVIENGADPAVIENVYTPIGLAIGAQTPEEIAVAIAAQIIQVKNRKAGGSFPTEILDAALDEKNAGCPMALATIISRKGSAPREAGAKMLVLADGTCIGTIGGGCAEAEIQEKALLMLREGRRFALCRTDLSADTAQEEGMICGGMLDVMLELIHL